MPRVRKYLDIDVVTAARQRIRHLYDIFDSVVIMFSGGKDSSCVLELARELHDEEGLPPIEVVFWDEEIMPVSNIEFLEKYREADWMNFRWFCLPHIENKFILGQQQEYIRWDPNRKWTRPMPEWAITPEKLGLDPTKLWGGGGEYSSDDLLESLFPGSVAMTTGVRASESLSRYRSVVNKLNENYICQIEGRTKTRLRTCKPIYDWMENDVLKYLHETDVGWCDVYEGEELSGAILRVAPPLGIASAKRFGKIRAMDPDWYASLIESFPEMLVQERYWDEFDQDALVNRYSPDGWNGILHYIEDWVEPGAYRDQCLQRYRYYRKMAEKRPDEFPPDHLLRITISGSRDNKVRGIDTNTKQIRNAKK